MKRHFGKLLFVAFFLWLAYGLLVPILIWDGAIWIATHVEVSDATTGKPISGAAVTLQTELRTKFPDVVIRSPSIVSAHTDIHGCATLKEMFPAGGDQSGTGAHVGTLIPRGPGAVTLAAGRIWSTPRRSKYSIALGKRGEEIVLQYLSGTLSPAEVTTLRWTSSFGELPGWDIDYTSAGVLHAVEVKASGGAAFPSIEVSANEWNAAKRLGSAYCLVLVAHVRSTSPQIQIIENPAALVEEGQISLEPSMWRLAMSRTG